MASACRSTCPRPGPRSRTAWPRTAGRRSRWPRTSACWPADCTSRTPCIPNPATRNCWPLTTVTVSHNPISNLKLGAGIAPLPGVPARPACAGPGHRLDGLQQFGRPVRGDQDRGAAAARRCITTRRSSAARTPWRWPPAAAPARSATPVRSARGGEPADLILLRHRRRPPRTPHDRPAWHSCVRGPRQRRHRRVRRRSPAAGRSAAHHPGRGSRSGPTSLSGSMPGSAPNWRSIGPVS